MSESVSACGCSYTAVSTATRGRVTRSAAPRNNCSTSKVVDTIRSVAHFLESIKNPGGSLRRGPTSGRRNATGLAAKGVGLTEGCLEQRHGPLDRGDVDDGACLGRDRRPEQPPVQSDGGQQVAVQPTLPVLVAERFEAACG